MGPDVNKNLSQDIPGRGPQDVLGQNNIIRTLLPELYERCID